MFWPSLLAASTLAVQAAAQLVPLELIPTSVDGADLASLINAHNDNQDSAVVALGCPGCAFDTTNDHQDDHPQDSHNSLMLNFTIDHAENKLNLNGKTIYPVEFPLTAELYAPLARSDDAALSPPLHLSYMIEYAAEHEANPLDDHVIVPIKFGILEMEGLPVNLPKVSLVLVKVAGETLYLASVVQEPLEDGPMSQCRTSICRVREAIIASLRKMAEEARARAGKAGERLGMKGCGRKQATGSSTEEATKLPGHRVDHHGMHGHRHRHHRHAGFHKFVHRATHLFIIPALLGIIGGLTASAIGMLVGQTVVFLWFRFVRGGRRGGVTSVRATEVGLEEEKEALVEEDFPARYED